MKKITTLLIAIFLVTVGYAQNPTWMPKDGAKFPGLEEMAEADSIAVFNENGILNGYILKDDLLPVIDLQRVTENGATTDIETTFKNGINLQSSSAGISREGNPIISFGLHNEMYISTGTSIEQVIIQPTTGSSEGHTVFTPSGNIIGSVNPFSANHLTDKKYVDSVANNIDFTGYATEVWTQEQISDSLSNFKIYVNDEINEVNNDIPTSTSQLINDGENGTSTYLEASEKASSNGLATLDSNEKLVESQLPDIAITHVLTALENSLSAFAANSSAYTFEEGDVIIIEDSEGNLSHYIYKGGDKTNTANYSLLNSEMIPISQVDGLQEDLDSKADDSDVVHKAGYEVITGKKSFNGGAEPIQLRDASETNAQATIGWWNYNAAARKGYIGFNDPSEPQFSLYSDFYGESLDLFTEEGVNGMEYVGETVWNTGNLPNPANDDDVIHTTGNETINGTKTIEGRISAENGGSIRAGDGGSIEVFSDTWGTRLQLLSGTNSSVRFQNSDGIYGYISYDNSNMRFVTGDGVGAAAKLELLNVNNSSSTGDPQAHVATFRGIVKGEDAQESDEFVTLGQMNDAIVNVDGGGGSPTGGLNHRGTWNAATNTPALLDGTGSVGDFYKVTTPGVANLGNGAYKYDYGDWVIFAAGVWQKPVRFQKDSGKVITSDYVIDYFDSSIINNSPSGEGTNITLPNPATTQNQNRKIRIVSFFDDINFIGSYNTYTTKNGISSSSFNFGRAILLHSIYDGNSWKWYEVN